MAFVFSKTTPATGAQAMYDLKVILVTAGWTVESSGDGLALYGHAGSLPKDRLTSGGTGAAGFNNTNAWYRIASPDGREFCIQRTTGSTVYRIKFSRTSTFIGGLPSSTRVPSAADEDVTWSGGSDAAPTGTTLFSADGGLYRWNIGADNAAPYGWWSGAFLNGGGACQTAFVYEQLTPSDATDSAKLLVYISSVVIGSVPFANAGSGMGQEGQSTAANVIYGHVPSAGAGAAAVWMGCALHTTSRRVVPSGTATNAISAKDEVFPIVYARPTAIATPGFKGIGLIMKWNGTIRSNGDTMTISTTRDRIIYADVNLPWDGTIPTV